MFECENVYLTRLPPFSANDPGILRVLTQDGRAE